MAARARRPHTPGMASNVWRDIVEARSADARARGLFDRLRPRGAPVADAASDLPESDRFEARVAQSLGAAPAEIERVREVRALRQQLASATEPEARARIVRALRDAEIERDVLLERTGRAILIPLLARQDAADDDDPAYAASDDVDPGETPAR